MTVQEAPVICSAAAISSACDGTDATSNNAPMPAHRARAARMFCFGHVKNDTLDMVQIPETRHEPMSLTNGCPQMIRHGWTINSNTDRVVNSVRTSPLGSEAAVLLAESPNVFSFARRASDCSAVGRAAPIRNAGAD